MIEPLEIIGDAPTGPRRKKWTREELAALERSGATDSEHFELVEGELYDTTGKHLPHVNTLHQILIVLCEIFGIARVTPERPIDVGAADRPSNDPQPDIVVLNRSFNTFQSGPPQPQDLALVVEVSDTTLRFDLQIKGGVYARSGIVEYWVVDVNGRNLIVHRQPEQGRYTSIVSYDVNESVTPLAAPEHTIAVRALFLER